MAEEDRVQEGEKTAEGGGNNQPPGILPPWQTEIGVSYIPPVAGSALGVSPVFGGTVLGTIPIALENRLAVGVNADVSRALSDRWGLGVRADGLLTIEKAAPGASPLPGLDPGAGLLRLEGGPYVTFLPLKSGKLEVQASPLHVQYTNVLQDKDKFIAKASGALEHYALGAYARVEVKEGKFRLALDGFFPYSDGEKETVANVINNAGKEVVETVRLDLDPLRIGATLGMQAGLGNGRYIEPELFAEFVRELSIETRTGEGATSGFDARLNPPPRVGVRVKIGF